MTRKTVSEIQAFIVHHLSGKLKTAPAGLALDEPLTELGISSREAVMLTGELEEFIGRPVDPALPWEYPTIASLSEHLAGL
jgi:acyl carrier protein